MKLEVSCTREETLVFCAWTKVTESSLSRSSIFKTILNVKLWPTRWSSNWSLLYKFCDKISKYPSPYVRTYARNTHTHTHTHTHNLSLSLKDIQHETCIQLAADRTFTIQVNGSVLIMHTKLFKLQTNFIARDKTPYLLDAMFHVCVACTMIIIVFLSGYMLRFGCL